MNDEREPEDMTVPEYWARKYLAAGNPGDPEVVCNWFHAAMLHAAAAPHMMAEAWDEGRAQGRREGADEDLIVEHVNNPYRSHA